MNATVTAAERATIAPVTQERLAELGVQVGNRPIVRIQITGSMRAVTCLGDDILPYGREARAVLGYLCLAGGQPVSRVRLATVLWSHAPNARDCLEQALRELSSAFGNFARELVSTDRDAVKLNAETCWVDALAAVAIDASSLDSLPGDLFALCEGELLEGLDGLSASFDRWLLDQRIQFAERLQLLLAAALNQTKSKNPLSKGLKEALAGIEQRAEFLRARRSDSQELANPMAPASTIALLPDRVPAARRQTPKQRAETGRDRLRVGVLPFLSHGVERLENLAFSLSQEIAGALTRFRWFDVIAPVSLRRTPTTRFIGERELRRMGLDYIVDGTVTNNSAGLQISVQLLELSEYARPVWTDCFNLAIGELHRLNELVTVRIVGRIDPVILWIEGQPGKRRDKYGATGLLLQAIPLMISMERRKYEEAGRLIDRALEIEPDNARVLAWAAHWHHFNIGQGWGEHSQRGFSRAQDYALKAIRLEPTNAEALGIYAHYCSVADRDFDTAVVYFERALRLNPSLAANWALSAATYCYIGEPDIALQRMERYRELAPLDPYSSLFENCYTIAYVFKKDYERAAVVGRRAVNALPDFINGYKPLVTALGHLGRRAEAKIYVDKLLSLEPGFTIQRHAQVYPFKKESDRRNYLKGLRLAGVPEC